LITENQLNILLAELHFVKVQTFDETRNARAFFEGLKPMSDKSGWLQLGVFVLMGSDAAAKVSNLLKNIREEKLKLQRGVYRKPTTGMTPARTMQPGS